jgi:hypothetical protein
MGEKRTACAILIGRPEREERLERHRRRWKDNIKLYIKGRLWEGFG